MNKAVFLAAALLLTPLPVLGQQTQQSQDQAQNRDQSQSGASKQREGGNERSMRDELLERLSKSDLRDRLASGVERIQDACADDIDRFCGDITPGGGRIAGCVRAYSDQFSLRCRFTLRRAVNTVERAVENIADTCMSAVEKQCGDTDNVRECVQQKSSSLPQSCQTIVAVATQARQALAAREQEQEQEPSQAPQQSAAQQGGTQQGGTQQQGMAAQENATPGALGQGLASLKGLPVFSSDGKNLGQIVQVERGPGGKIQSVQIQIGRLLGLGEKTITLEANKLEQLGDRIRLLMSSDQVRSLPEARGGGSAQH
jgi:hypothetical protein